MGVENSWKLKENTEMLKPQSSRFYHVLDRRQIGAVTWCCSQLPRINFQVSIHFALFSVFYSNLLFFLVSITDLLLLSILSSASL